jgi:demethylmenaquinone methyltransferase/2-methoxy-6-polyprenyl-1,4-benzoquinol methylase
MPYQLPPPEQKARYVRAKFDEIARRYGLFNDLITQGQHRRWKRVLVRRLGLKPDARGADVCCGTGDIALRCLARLGPGGGVLAADFSPNMLRIAQRRLASGAAAAAAGRPARPRAAESGAAANRVADSAAAGRAAHAPHRQVLCADAMRLPFRTASLDFVTIGYGLRNVVDLDGCLREIHRVLKPGGVLGSLDVGKVTRPWLRPLVDFYFFHVVPAIGRLVQRGQDMFAYLPASSLAYPGQEALRQRLLDTGFARAEIEEFVFGASVIHLAWKKG